MISTLPSSVLGVATGIFVTRKHLVLDFMYLMKQLLPGLGTCGWSRLSERPPLIGQGRRRRISCVSSLGQVEGRSSVSFISDPEKQILQPLGGGAMKRFYLESSATMNHVLTSGDGCRTRPVADEDAMGFPFAAFIPKRDSGLSQDYSLCPRQCCICGRLHICTSMVGGGDSLVSTASLYICAAGFLKPSRPCTFGPLFGTGLTDKVFLLHLMLSGPGLRSPRGWTFRGYCLSWAWKGTRGADAGRCWTITARCGRSVISTGWGRWSPADPSFAWQMTIRGTGRTSCY